MKFRLVVVGGGGASKAALAAANETSASLSSSSKQPFFRRKKPTERHSSRQKSHRSSSSSNNNNNNNNNQNHHCCDKDHHDYSTTTASACKPNKAGKQKHQQRRESLQSMEVPKPCDTPHHPTKKGVRSTQPTRNSRHATTSCSPLKTTTTTIDMDRISHPTSSSGQTSSKSHRSSETTASAPAPACSFWGPRRLPRQPISNSSRRTNVTASTTSTSLSMSTRESLSWNSVRALRPSAYDNKPYSSNDNSDSNRNSNNTALDNKETATANVTVSKDKDATVPPTYSGAMTSTESLSRHSTQLQQQETLSTTPTPTPNSPTPLSVFRQADPSQVGNKERPRDHAFQMVPNPLVEFGMLHNDCASIEEAILLQQQEQYHQQAIPEQLLSRPSTFIDLSSTTTGGNSWKPILVLDAEIPGNQHAGKTIFSHPLIVEAIETFFVVVTCCHSALPQVFQPATTLPKEHTQSSLSSTSTALSSLSNPTATPAFLNININHKTGSTSKMGGNYLYTRLRILDPLTGCDLVACVDDRRLSRASVLQAMLDSLAMICPQQPIPTYLTNLLQEEQAQTRGAAIRHRRMDLHCNYLHDHHHQQHHHQQQNNNSTETNNRIEITTTTSSSAPQQYRGHAAIPAHSSFPYEQGPLAPVAVFGMEHTALGEVMFAQVDGVISTEAAWVVPHLVTPYKERKRRQRSSASPSSKSQHHPSNEHYHQDEKEPSRQAVVKVSYDPRRISYCTLAKVAVELHANQSLGKPSCLTLYYTSNDEQVSAQMHTRAHYRQILDTVDPNNPAKFYYCNHSTSITHEVAHETIRVVQLHERQGVDDEVGVSCNRLNPTRRSTSSSTSSEQSFSGLNNSMNKTHPGYKVPNYDGVVERAAAKAATEKAKKKDLKLPCPTFIYVLKHLSPEGLYLQGSKPALRESHLRFVPLTPLQATQANMLVFDGKFHLAMKLLSPRQGMILMHALRSGGRLKRCVCPPPAILLPVSVPSSIELVHETPSSSSKTARSNNEIQQKTLGERPPQSDKPLKPRAVSSKGSSDKANTTKDRQKFINKKKQQSAKTQMNVASASSKDSAEIHSLRAKTQQFPSHKPARFRRASTTELVTTSRKSSSEPYLPKQAPRQSFGPKAMDQSAAAAVAAAESLRQESDKPRSPPRQRRASSKVTKRADGKGPLIPKKKDEAGKEVNDEAPWLSAPTNVQETTCPRSNDNEKTWMMEDVILYSDVVDVPILEAWDTFVLYPQSQEKVVVQSYGYVYSDTDLLSSSSSGSSFSSSSRVASHNEGHTYL